MAFATEEIFGPLAPVFTFETEEEAIAMANETVFGLASYVYTRDLGRAFRINEKLQYGMIGINSGLITTVEAPFGGVKGKRHGQGRREPGARGLPRYEIRLHRRHLTAPVSSSLRRWQISGASPLGGKAACRAAGGSCICQDEGERARVNLDERLRAVCDPVGDQAQGLACDDAALGVGCRAGQDQERRVAVAGEGDGLPTCW